MAQYAREIVFDTETTGFDPTTGDRIVEIGMVELYNHIASGKTFHVYINPERDMPQGAYEVHGLSSEFLSDKPKFAEIVDDMIAFVGDDSLLIAHNASFDMNFINYELEQVGHAAIADDRVLDTLKLARRKHPAGPNSLDALCARYNIDNSMRTKHGALLDSEILAEVYIELIGGRQAGLDLSAHGSGGRQSRAGRQPVKQRPSPLPSRLTEAEITAHKAFVATIGDKALWYKKPLKSE